VLAAALVLIVNGGGLLVPASAVGGLLLGLLCDRTFPERRFWAAMGVLLAVTMVGVALRVEAPHHAELHATTLAHFWALFSRCLAWPFVQGMDVAFFVMQAPLAWLLLHRFRQRKPLTTAELIAVMIAIYTVLSAAAMAYSRGRALYGVPPLSRYQDTLILGAAAQSFAIFRIAAEQGRRTRLLAAGWILILGVGLVALTRDNLARRLPIKQIQDEGNLIMVRSYAMTGDASIFISIPGFESPHPSKPENVALIMADPVLKPYLPMELTQPQGTPFNHPFLIRHSRMLTLIFGGLFVLSLLWPFARNSRSNPLPKT